ncbi:uncharacterized protein EI90DRAFT_3291685 [Cantharellus anzutake]|uniref:uncharacterized protein n=1 Tax=Cantharellus anzutake TaxID=1750568 RepID=UPI0019050C8B|nr:uncharacterized protein EI90DRAFT_3291685 [Cantharellus anzutake]KAF8325648.1 hypothetical protein EI90DRAFT_3291685 [Cantharellus anzutake]
MSYAAPKQTWPPNQRPSNNGTPPTSHPIDIAEHHTYNPFDDGPPVPIRRKAREVSDSFNSTINEDMYSQQPFKVESLDAHADLVFGHTAGPTRRTPTPPHVSAAPATSPPNKNPFQRIPVQAAPPYAQAKPVRLPPPPFLSAAINSRESYWTPSNLPSSDTPSHTSTKGSDTGETIVEAWSSRERLSETTLQAEEEDDDSAPDIRQQQPQLPYTLYGHVQRAKASNVVMQQQQQPQVKQSPSGVPHRFVGESFAPERLSLRTEDVPLPDSDDVDSSPVQVTNSSPTPSHHYAPPHSSPLRRRGSDVVVAPTSPQAVDVVLQPTSKPNLGNAPQQAPSQRKLPTPPSSHGTPPSVHRASPIAVNPAGPSLTSPPGTVASAYATPAASSGQEETPTRVRSRISSPTPASGNRSRNTGDAPERLDSKPQEQQIRTQPHRPTNIRTDTFATATTSPTIPTRAPGAPPPDRSFPVREDDYRARSARPIVYGPNWYQPPMYAPLDYVPDFIYMDPTHVQGGLDMSINSRGSPAPSSAVLRDGLQLGTPRSPLTNLPAYEYPQEPLSEDPDAVKDDEMRSRGPFDAAEVQHALWVLEQQRRLYAPQPRYHSSSGHPHRFETTTPAEPHPLDQQERPQSTTSSNDLYSGIRPDAPIPPTPRPNQSLPSTSCPPESAVSSPSHHPIPLPTRKAPRSRSKGRTRKQPLPPRMASTLPPSSDTADDVNNDDDDDGELTPGRAQVEDEGQDALPSDDDTEDVWLEKDKEDKLDLEYHPSYLNVAVKRKKRFQEKYQELLRVFRELDRSTDATMLLMVSPTDPSTPSGTHLVASRAILRSPGYLSTAHRARALFSKSISASRRVVKTEQALREEERRRLEEIEKEASEMRQTLANIEVMAAKAESSGGEASLKAALRATLDGLRQMQKISEEREMRRRDEAARQQRENPQTEKLRRKLAGKVH